ncbi:type VII secretion protein EccCb [Nocardia sp. BMG51109]|uniref:type VII secretion protein EccCb n=1 Tax=Nocardia sp. BMG51109 TaxID=1056816 RepID=UPI0004B768E4|nr:type VII secretion protein EccCb [Nocardia sp. BMG51109]
MESEPATQRGGDGDAREGPDGGLSGPMPLGGRTGPTPLHNQPGPTPVDGDVDFADLYGLDEPENIDTRELWKPRFGRERLRIPIGIDAAGRPVELDIKTAMEHGNGPNGVVVGSPESERYDLLRAIVLGLAVRHSPEAVNFLLVDFHGRGTFDGLTDLPHVSAHVSGVAQNPFLASRIMEVAVGECHRRLAVLKDSGNFGEIAEYERARSLGADLDPLPSLVLVIDEFSEFVSVPPDSRAPFAALGRLGGRLGIHLLAGAQRLDEEAFTGLEGHLAYRIALGDLSTNELRPLLHADDLRMLPNPPGHGYLCVYPEPIRFKPVRAARRVTTGSSEKADRTLLEALVSQLHWNGMSRHEIWLPPLDAPPTLDQLLTRTVVTGEHVRIATLRTAIGIIDRPFEQRRDPLTVDLSGPQGNAAVVGGPESGKSTALRSLIMALSLTHTAEQVQFYCLDFGGGALAGIEGLPHVGAVACPGDGHLVRRIVGEMAALMSGRKQRFRTAGIESMAQFRKLRAGDSSDAPGASVARADPYGDAFLVIDNLPLLDREFDTLGLPIVELAAEGPSYGVHVVVTVRGWFEVGHWLKDRFGTCVELRPQDPARSELDPAYATLIPPGRPGRGMTADYQHLLTALPRLDGNPDPRSLAGAEAEAVATVRQCTPGQPAPRIRPLPELVRREELLWPGGDRPADPARACLRFPIGINESALAPVCLDFDANPHFLVVGDSGSGKTTLLRSIIAAICASNTADRARIVTASYRDGPTECVPAGFDSGYATNWQTLEQLLSGLARFLANRMSRPGAPRWSGPEMFAVIDDYDLMVPPTIGRSAWNTDSPAWKLVELLPFAREIGFHMIVARTAHNAARSLYEPMLGGLRRHGAAGLVMSGHPDEGELIGGIAPQPLPPGRGILTTRGTTELIQTGWMPPR